MIDSRTPIGAAIGDVIPAAIESDDDDDEEDERLVSDSEDEGEYAEFGNVSRESFLGPLIRALIWRPHVIVLSFLVRTILLLIVAWPLILLGIIVLIVASFVSMHGPDAVVTVVHGYNVAIMPLNIAITSVNVVGLFVPVVATITNDLYVSISAPIRDLLEAACPVVFKRDPDTIPDVTDTEASCPALHHFNVFMFGFYEDLVIIVEALKDAYTQTYNFIREDLCMREGTEENPIYDCSNICGAPNCLDPIWAIVAIMEPIVWAIFMPVKLFASVVNWIFSTFAIVTGEIKNFSVPETAAYIADAFGKLWYEIRKWIINVAIGPVDMLNCYVVELPGPCIVQGMCGVLFRTVPLPFRALCATLLVPIKAVDIFDAIENPCSDIDLDLSPACDRLKNTFSGSCDDCRKVCHPFFGQGSSDCVFFKMPCRLGKDSDNVEYPCGNRSVMKKWDLRSLYPD